MNPAQHPYLANEARPSLKRKHSYYTSASSEVASASSTNYSPASDASDLPVFVDSADTTIDASQGSFRPLAKRRRHETLGVEGDFNGLVLGQKLREEMLNGAGDSRETPVERQERFWEMDGEVEVDMDTGSYSPSNIMHPSSVHSPTEQRSTSEPVASGPSWYEVEKDRIVITSLDSDSESSKGTPPQNALMLENGELVSNAVVAALKGGTSVFRNGFGPSALFDARRWGDLTALERMTAGMGQGTPFGYSDEEMVDVTPPVERDEMAMDVEEL